MRDNYWLSLSVLFVFLPAWIGMAWVRLLQISGKASRILHAWVFGFVTIWAVSQVILVPLVLMQKTLTFAILLWKLALSILTVLALFVWLADWARQEERKEARHETGERGLSGNPVRGRGWGIALGGLALILVAMQAYIPARYEHRDDDDSRFISEQVSAVVHDTMYQDNPINSTFWFEEDGEVQKDFTSPWAMYLAICCRIADIAPAVLSHSYLPFYLVCLCYALYALMGQKLFDGSWEKTFVFLIFLSVLNLWGYTSTHTLGSMLLLRIWQGKAVCASFLLPFLFYVMYQIMQEQFYPGWVAMLYVAALAACLLSGIGIVTTPIVLFIYGLVDFCCYRSFRKTLAVFLAAVPCAIFLGYYLM